MHDNSEFNDDAMHLVIPECTRLTMTVKIMEMKKTDQDKGLEVANNTGKAM